MLQGLQGAGPIQLRRAFTIVSILVWLYYLLYGIWALNNLALILDDVEDDRYVTIDFWRLVFPFLTIFSPLMTVYLLYNNLRVNRFYPYNLHCIIVVASMIIGLIWIVWLSIDVVDCSNIVYCDGDGNGPLGIDIAFWVAGITQILMFIINVIFFFYNFYIKGKVQERNILDFYSNPSRAPIPGNTAAGLRGAAFYPTNFISTDINDDNSINTTYNYIDEKDVKEEIKEENNDTDFVICSKRE